MDGRVLDLSVEHDLDGVIEEKESQAKVRDTTYCRQASGFLDLDRD
jgi:hypothetical protein